MVNENREFYQRCIDVWGKDAQIKMCIEEMSELTKELCKSWRKDQENPDLIRNICEEIADVQNMADEMQMIFGEELVEKFRKEKIERTNKRLDEETKNG